MSQPIAKFWMVYGLGQGAPRYEHLSKAGAQIEAARLAKANPGVTFVVLAAVDAVTASMPAVSRVEITKPVPLTDTDDLIPF
ncbi:hypothetical protein [Ensifer sp. 1H6]|uniref:hypothetical protein n=1 Tax=Ensifer sp. 1H6 TaxID=1911585 RepID=UPI0009CC6E47|nr:hypothetical protein [Ensifer sp. 1H6]OMQ42040.1 hypothetical protein BKP54_25180 [Ensifer sp. 1H6]